MTARAARSGLRAAKEERSERLLGPIVAAQAEGAFRVSTRRVRGAPSSAPARNVVGVGVGEKIVGGKPVGIMCVRFLVRVKYPAGQLARGERLPTEVDGLPVDVEQVGTFRKFAARKSANRRRKVTMPDPRARHRPAQPGSSVGFQDPGNAFRMAGTFGAVVKKGATRYILSNNHVLADENQLPVGAPIFQPGLLDNGNANSDKVATLSQFVRLQAGANNAVDVAIAAVSESSIVNSEILYIGKTKGSTPAKIDMVVHKFGRTTSYRAGRITSIDTDVSVEYDTGIYVFAEQINIKGLNGQMFSDAGDSGSVILERDTNKVIGLLFAGSSAYTIANQIDDVLSQFGGITLA